MTLQNIVLDLDNTLISAIPIAEFQFDKKDIKEKSLTFPFYNMDNYYIVFERPYLQEFLDYIFNNYNISVWTAASKDYAMFIVDKIIYNIEYSKDRKLDFILFSEHGSKSKKLYEGAPKQLDMLWDKLKLSEYNKDNTIIIDDYKKVGESQPYNTIQIFPFEFEDKDSEKDDKLKKLIEIINNNNEVEKITTIEF